MESKNILYKIKHQLVAIGNKLDYKTKMELQAVRREFAVIIKDLETLELIKKHLIYYSVLPDSYEHIKWVGHLKGNEEFNMMEDFIKGRKK